MRFYFTICAPLHIYRQFSCRCIFSCHGTRKRSRLPVYPLSAMENKLPFSVSLCSKQTKVSHFCLLFAANKRKLLFSVSSVFRLRNSKNMET